MLAHQLTVDPLVMYNTMRSQPYHLRAVVMTGVSVCLQFHPSWFLCTRNMAQGRIHPFPNTIIHIVRAFP